MTAWAQIIPGSFYRDAVDELLAHVVSVLDTYPVDDDSATAIEIMVYVGLWYVCASGHTPRSAQLIAPLMRRIDWWVLQNHAPKNPALDVALIASLELLRSLRVGARAVECRSLGQRIAEISDDLQENGSLNNFNRALLACNIVGAARMLCRVCGFHCTRTVLTAELYVKHWRKTYAEPPRAGKRVSVPLQNALYVATHIVMAYCTWGLHPLEAWSQSTLEPERRPGAHCTQRPPAED